MICLCFFNREFKLNIGIHNLCRYLNFVQVLFKYVYLKLQQNSPTNFVGLFSYTNFCVIPIQKYLYSTPAMFEFC